MLYAKLWSTLLLHGDIDSGLNVYIYSSVIRISYISRVHHPGELAWPGATRIKRSSCQRSDDKNGVTTITVMMNGTARLALDRRHTRDSIRRLLRLNSRLAIASGSTLARLMRPLSKRRENVDPCTSSVSIAQSDTMSKMHLALTCW